jgi:hypothetical protein
MRFSRTEGQRPSHKAGRSAGFVGGSGKDARGTRADCVGKVMVARCGRISRGFTPGCRISSLRPSGFVLPVCGGKLRSGEWQVAWMADSAPSHASFRIMQTMQSDVVRKVAFVREWAHGKEKFNWFLVDGLWLIAGTRKRSIAAPRPAARDRLLMVDPATRCAARDRWPVRNPVEVQKLEWLRVALGWGQDGSSGSLTF